MPTDNQLVSAHQVATPQHYMPPTARELRAHAVHRLQVGLLGICAMLLLVGLANVIMDRAREVEAQEPAAEEALAPPLEPKAKKKAADPLADIGVAPAADPSVAPAEPPAP